MANSLIDEKGRLNTKNYNQKVSKQREIFGKIDSTMAILEKLPSFTNTAYEFLDTNSFSYSTSPLGFIFNILHALGVSEETLKKWIVEILVNVLPTVEVGVKASLLSNIKEIVSCNADPRIPLWLRKKVTESVFTNVLTGRNEQRGIDINIDAIDPYGILDLSPFTEPGMMYYFGCTKDNVRDTSIKKTVSKYDDGLTLDTVTVIGDGNARTAKLARAEDFNAFLWYVIHKGNKQNPAKMSFAIDGSIKIDGDDTITYSFDDGTENGVIELKVNGNNESNIIAGNTFYYPDCPNNIYICIKSKVNNEGVVTGNTIVPMSSDWFSCNWYVDKNNYYSSNIGYKSKTERKYKKEKAICNLMYSSSDGYLSERYINYPNGLRFTILPKPYVLLPTIVTTSTLWRPVRLLFDADGNADQNGRFSLISETYDLQPTLRNETALGNNVISYDVYGIDENGSTHTECCKLRVSGDTGKYELITSETYENTYKSALVECYPGLTVYEFNYDYIMGMKLFDAKVICQRIFDNAANPAYDAHFLLTLNKTKDIKNKFPYESGKQKISEIVREILEEDGDDELTDCFFKFSNAQYDEMLRKSEEIRYRQFPYNQGYNEGLSINFTEVTKILETFPEDGTIEEQQKVIEKALTMACDEIANRGNISEPSDRSTGRIDFLTDILQQLVAAIVEAVISPKILMLLIVNDVLMGGETNGSFNTETLMKALKGVIKSLVSEVRDLIIKKLVDYIIEYLTPLALQIREKILSEQFAAYMAILKLLLGYFNKGVETASRISSIMSSMNSIIKNRLGEGYKYGDITEIDLPSILDDVNYADIYDNDTKDKEPTLNNC